jgi:hypothetical protein
MITHARYFGRNMKPQVDAAAQLLGNLVGQSGRAVEVREQALDDEREAERQQQPYR